MDPSLYLTWPPKWDVNLSASNSPTIGKPIEKCALTYTSSKNDCSWGPKLTRSSSREVRIRLPTFFSVYVSRVEPSPLFMVKVDATGGPRYPDIHMRIQQRSGFWGPKLKLPDSKATYPLKLQALGKLICCRHIAHVTQTVENLCF